MSRKKEEVEKLMKDVKNQIEAVLEKKRLKWFEKVCREARETYQFSGLGELVMWMIDHTGDIQLKSGDVNVEVTGCESVLARSKER